MHQAVVSDTLRFVRAGARLVAFLAAGLPASAYAQVNIDQGKSAAELFAGDCATCHKSPRGLANGQGSLGLASFLSEHYTSNRQEAAALAAYVLGAGGADRGAPAAAGPGRGTKPPERGRAAVEEPKPPGRVPQEAARRTEPRVDNRRPETGPATAKLRPLPRGEAKKPGEVPDVVEEPAGSGRRPAAADRPAEQPTEASAHPTEPESKPVNAAPAAAESAAPAPSQEPAALAPGATAAAPASSDSGESAPAPRDNIPD